MDIQGEKEGLICVDQQNVEVPNTKDMQGRARGGGDSGFLFFTTTASGFGCTTGAFSYSSLHHKKCQDASSDYGNPNIYNALDNIKVKSTTVAIG